MTIRRWPRNRPAIVGAMSALRCRSTDNNPAWYQLQWMLPFMSVTLRSLARHSLHRSNSLRRSWLTRRTIVRATLCDDNTLNRRSANYTGQTGTLIDTHMIIIIARLAPEVSIIVKRCAAMFYAPFKHNNNSFVQARNLRYV